MRSTFKDLKRNLKKDFKPSSTIKLALLGDTATQFLSTAIIGYGAELGIKIELYEAPYNQIELQFRNPTSNLYAFIPDYVIVFQSEAKLKDTFYKMAQSERASFHQNIVDDIKFYDEIVADKLRAKFLYLNFCEVNDGVFGNYAAKYEDSFLYQLRAANFKLAELALLSKNLNIIDVLSLQNTFGINFVKSAHLLIQADMYFSLDFLPHIAKAIFDNITSHLGWAKKCLILDLDNTIWGGVIGDDGLNNIQIGGLGIGKVYSKLQRWAKELKNRGIIICVASKNTESIAIEPFRKHPEMILKEEDMSVFMANWDNKVKNIQKIQEILNIGFDSMVFVDDNPFEREMVKQQLPLVTVPNLPDDPAFYLDYLAGLNLFETVSISTNDSKRTSQYQQEAERVKAKTYFENEDEFLESLEMLCNVEQLNEFNLPRLAQLSLRSNQFNLRTIRFDEESLTKFVNDTNQYAIGFSLKDKYGDHGLIAALFLSKKDDILFVDNWIMSCRVLKRGMEKYTLNIMVKFAKEIDCKIIEGEFIPTSKNGIVENHYEDLGFMPVKDRWMLDLNNYISTPNKII